MRYTSALSMAVPTTIAEENAEAANVDTEEMVEVEEEKNDEKENGAVEIYFKPSEGEDGKKANPTNAKVFSTH